MPPLTRRRALRLGGAAFTAALAGCSAFGGQSPPTLRLGRLVVTNYDRRPHTVHVLFVTDDSPDYWASKRVPPGDETSPGFARFEDYPTEPGDSVLHVRTDSQPKPGWERLDFGEQTTSCVGLVIGIGDPNGTSPGDVTIWKTNNEHECDGMTTTER
ncbi:hypothetical protein V5735_14455 (plasmid) [Haladaptatus sp. SPP-AMP-3]|uniref:hypothetical protein n=1 Tax=Haladaptatus sp. SPP-AMP-3 TaxID=3121295 RepID=UPI003C2F3AA6